MRRRTLLLSGLGGAGALVVGWALLPPRSRTGAVRSLAVDADAVSLNGWIAIGGDGAVQLAMARSEMGQGVHTGLAMLVAEELDVPLARVRLVEAGHDALYGNVASFVAGLPFHPRDALPGDETPLVRASHWIVRKLAREMGINITGGSSSLTDLWQPLRLAAATARARLLGAASLAWKLPLAELTVTDGVVAHASGPRAGYAELARRAAATPPGDVQTKRREHWRLVGRPAPRLDAAAKSRGAAVFGVDVRPPGLLYAVVRHPPALGGSPGAVDDQRTMALPGVLRVVRLGAYAGSTPALAVVGRTTWHALQGAQALQVQWRARPAGALDSAVVLAELERTARQAAARGGGLAFHRRGDAAKALREAPRTVEAVYRAPHLAHAAMEPVNCTARVADGRVEVWAPTQVPGLARAVAAQAAGVDEDAVTLHVTYLGGGFGRRLEVDVVGQAVRVALETGGAPVQLLWPREEDFGHDFYRPAGVAVLQAALDDDGLPTALAVATAGDAVTPRWLERALPQLAMPFDLPDKTTSEGLFDQPYVVPHTRIAHVATHSGVPVGFWRAGGHSHNAFFGESFIDELAHAGGRDPLELRLALLAAMPRQRAVLELAARAAGWGAPLAVPAGAARRARGLALHESFGSVVAQVVEASLVDGRPRVHRVVCAIDCGTVVNPMLVAQQMESGVMFGLAAALHGRIDIEDGIVRQRNFPDQPLPTLADTPAIETHIVPSTLPPSGVGETAVPPIAPALANAVFALTGVRLRELPLRLSGD